MKRHTLIRNLGLASSASIFGLFACGALAASNAIEKVEFSQLPGEVLIKLQLRQPLAAQPSDFTVSNPPRVAFDFNDTENTSGTSSLPAGVGSLRSLNLVQVGDRTRLVLNLSEANRYRIRTEGNSLFISLPRNETAAVAATSAPPPRAEATASAATPRATAAPLTPVVQDMDFRAESADLAVFKLNLSEPNALVDVRQQGRDLVLVLPGTSLPERLVKRLDVKDYGTPVDFVTASRSSSGTQLVFNNKGEWDYNVRQLDNQVFIEVRRTVVDPTSLAGSKDVQGKVVSFNFTQPVPVSQMIGIFQDITGLNFMVMPGVSGEIQSLKMDNTPVETAIDVISRMYGLGFRRYGNIVVVGRADDLVKYDKDERDRAAALASSEPILQETFKIKYRTASEIVQKLSSGTSTTTGAPAAGAQQQPAAGAAAARTNSLISDRGLITYDDATNTIYIEETKTRLTKIRERIQSLDRPMRQVIIEARIVQVDDSFQKDLGVSLSGNIGYSIGNTTGSVAFSGGKTGGLVGTGGGSASGISLFNSAQTKIINLALAAVESDSRSKTISSPKILTRDSQKATLVNGQAIPYTVGTLNTGLTTSFVTAALTLDVTPQIQLDGRVQMDLIVQNDEPTVLNGSTGINKRSVNTKVVVENGGTVLIGGLFKQADTNAEDKVPFFGDLPVLGALFRYRKDVKTRTELLVFITPRVVTEDLVLQ
ncbi:MAG TPA: type IV pilus secretin PilQ [Rhodocyclaceae bacterium]|nr:type IV pilus secretin PilQ [Rhodocyclaceae bacterium]